MEDLVPTPKSKFLKVRCNECKNEQIIFNKAASDIDCLVCDETIAESAGGELELKGVRVLEVLG